MRRSLQLLIGVTVTLLAGCADKRELCAQVSVRDLSAEEVISYYKRLGIKKTPAKSRQANMRDISYYCQYYR